MRIKVALKDDGSAIYAEARAAYGPLAVTRILDKIEGDTPVWSRKRAGWTVTHVPSGCSAVPRREPLGRATAERFASLCAERFPWLADDNPKLDRAKYDSVCMVLRLALSEAGYVMVA